MENTEREILVMDLNEAIEHLKGCGKTSAEIAKILGYKSPSVFHNWVKRGTDAKCKPKGALNLYEIYGILVRPYTNRREIEVLLELQSREQEYYSRMGQ